MNMDMKTNMRETNICSPTKVKKRVTFAEGTKEHDGQTENDLMFCKVVLAYFKGEIKSEFDVYKFIRHDNTLILSLLVEAALILLKLNEIKKEEEMYAIIKRFLPHIPQTKYIPKDIEEVRIMQKWDTPGYNMAASKKCNAPKGAGLARRGSRIYTEKLMSVHIPHVNNFAKLLTKTYEIIINKKV
jgi:hypothetical protein